MKFLSDILAPPITRGLHIDDPKTTEYRKKIIKNNPLLLKIYEEWYGYLLSSIPNTNGKILEIGSGGGFLKEFASKSNNQSIICSDVFPVYELEIVTKAEALPFEDNCLKAIVMTNVFHHISNSIGFFEEATRTVMPGGVVAMIEPWLTPLSKFFYTFFHHEPLETNVNDYKFTSRGPLSSANLALPWMLFHRDKEKFCLKFPMWEIEKIKPIMPICYLISGGLSIRNLLPGCTYKTIRRIESTSNVLLKYGAMFSEICMVKKF